MGDYDFDFEDIGSGAEAIRDTGAEVLGTGAGSNLTGYASWAPTTTGGGDGGGFWSNLWGGLKDFGAGAKGALVGAGSLASAALPIAGLGTSILGVMAARDAAQQLGRQSQRASAAQDVQLQSARQAQALAPKVEPLATKVEALAPKVEAFEPDFRRVAGEIGAIAPKQDLVASRLQTTAEPLTSFGTKLLEAASLGKIPEAEQAEIDNWARQAKMQVSDYFTRAGLGDSTMLIEQLKWIDQQAVAMKGSRLDAEKKLGISAQQIGAGVIGAQSDVYGAEGVTRGREADVLGRGADVLRGAAATYGGAANILGTEGNILAGAGAQAGSAAQAAERDEEMLAQLIAAAQQQIARLSASR